MKTKIKRHSRSVISVILAVCMLVSCMTVGLIATDAARVSGNNTDSGETVGAKLDSELVGVSADYGANRKYLYIDFSGYSNKANFQGIDFFWDGSNNIPSGTKVGYIAKANMTEVATDIYRADLSTVTQYYSDLSGIQIIFTNTNDKWDQTFDKRGSDNNNCLKLSDASWSTKFNLWSGSSDTGLTNALFLVDGAELALSTSNTFINVCNAAYDNFRSGCVWTSSDDIAAKYITKNATYVTAVNQNNSGTYYARINAASDLAARCTHRFSYDKDSKVLTINTTPPPAYDIAIDNAEDCDITATYGASTASNNETLSDVYEGDTVSITVTPDSDTQKVTAISATGEGNVVSDVTDNGDGTYSATLTVAADGTISASLEDKAECTVTLNQASNGTAVATVGGVAQASSFTVLEGTTVTFTATPNEGYAFTGWSGAFADKTATVSKVIEADTTVAPTFALDGYQMLYSSDGTAESVVTTDMVKLPNGHWISASAIDQTASSLQTKLFTIKRIRDGYYVHSGAGSNSWAISNTEHIDLSDRWYESNPKDTAMKQFYSNNIADGYYLVFAPEEGTNGKLYLTDNDSDYPDVTVLAKDGTIRDWSGKTFTSDFGDTHITIVSPNDLTEDTDYEYDQYSYKTNDSDNSTARAEYIKFKGAAVNQGVTINIKTTVNETYANNGYFVKGFVVSTEEESYAVINQEFGNDGNEKAKAAYSNPDVYDMIHGVKSGDDYTALPYNEFNYTISGYPTKGIEITPIYYKAEVKSGDNVRFYVEGFEGDVKTNWTGMLAVDIYGETTRPFGEYPGQPMIKYNGRYVVDIPRADIRGITLNNYYWDKAHSHYYGVTNNYQTYDFNDFVYLNKKLTAEEKDEDIIFSFRYKKDNSHNTQVNSNLSDRVYYVDSDIYSESATPIHADDYRTGYATMTSAHEAMYQFEDLTDFYGNLVDVFDDPIESGSAKAAYNPLRIVSNGYDMNKAGRFATAWALYKPTNWTGDPGAYTLVDIVGGQGKADQSFQSESFLIDPEDIARVRLKYDNSVRANTPYTGTDTYNDPANATYATYQEGDTVFEHWKKKFCIQEKQDYSSFTKYPSPVADLAGVPAVITYEYEVGDDMPNKDLNSTASVNDANYAYRSDGRWFYTTHDELIQAHVIVEYANKPGSTYVRDYFQPESKDYTTDGYNPSVNTGLTTGIKAYFTNDGTETIHYKTFSNTYGYTEANGITDGEYTFDLVTEGDENGEYTFAGWYMLINGEYSFVTSNPVYHSEATNNDVYVARYYKIPSGKLNISHKLHSDSTGSGTYTVAVSILGSDGTTVVDSTTYPEVSSTTEAKIQVGEKYIKSTSKNNIQITLTTTEQNIATTFNGFYEKITSSEAFKALANSANALGLTATVSVSDKTATITFPIAALFTDGEQTIKTLPFFSKLSLPEYKYEITYNFASRKLIKKGKLSDDRLWGPQSYKHKGTFTAAEVKQYIDLTSTPTFKADKTAAYLAENSPYEKNFLEDIVWDFSNQTIAYNPETLTFSCSLTANQSTNTTITATFKLPFDYTLNTTTANAYTFSADNVYKDPALVVQHESVNMDFLDWFSLNDVKNKTQMTPEKQPKFLKVPDVLYNSATNPTKKRTFMYWEFYKEGDVIGTAEPYQKCYSSALNQAVYQNTIFYPKYTAELEMDAQEIKLVADAKTATITFLGVTRDQWNYNGGGADAYEIWHSMFADRIFTDFVMSFQYENKLIDSLGTNYKTGLIIQTLDPKGEIASVTPETLAAEYSSNNGKDDAIDKIKATNADISESGVNNYLISYNQQRLDDRNAIEYYYGIANVSQSTNPNNDTYTNVTTRRNYGYRAYSFIKKGTGDNAEVIISDPVYFTIYNVASITSGAALNTP